MKHVTFIGGALTACAMTLAPLAALALDEVKVGYQKLPPLAALVHGKEAGIFEANGIDIEIVVVNTGSDVINGLAAGSMTIVGSPAAGGVQARSAGLPLTAIGTSAIESFGHTEFQIVANGDKGIASAKDLEGHVVGVLEKASPAELHIREHMIADGGDPDKVQFVALPFPQLPAALEVGNVDAIGIAPPFLGQILGSQKITPVVVGEGMVATLETGGPTALGSWFAMQPWIEAGDNKDVAARFLKSVQESNEALMADRSLVDAILVRDFGMPAEVASHIPMNLLTTSLTAYPENYFEVIEAYKRTGMAEPNFTAEEFVTTLEYE
ncbi:ABC transporter substrate-binding protein (plasmid) [Shimia sp. W99]